jgi:hypothetical protein
MDCKMFYGGQLKKENLNGINPHKNLLMSFHPIDDRKSERLYKRNDNINRSKGDHDRCMILAK